MGTPRGGRMGIPRCGGMHGIMSEDLCLDCQQLTLEQEHNKQLKICQLKLILVTTKRFQIKVSLVSFLECTLGRRSLKM